MKSKNAKIVALYQLRFTEEELKSLPENYIGLLANLCFAINELNTFMLLFASTGTQPHDELVRQKWAIQKNVLTRVLASKVFEAFFGINRLLKKSCSKDVVPAATI